MYSLSMSASRRVLTRVFVVAWILRGPLAMAFGACLPMGDCEALYGTVAGAQLASTLIVVALVCCPLGNRTTSARLTPALFVRSRADALGGVERRAA
jgi:hypothetical protein